MTASPSSRDMRDPAKLGAAVLALRTGKRGQPLKSPLSRLYDRHKATLEAPRG